MIRTAGRPAVGVGKMSRILEEPIAVFQQGGRLAGFVHRRRYHIRSILEVWREVGDWWQGEPARSVYRVELTTGAVCEIYRHHGPGLGAGPGTGAGPGPEQWFLYKVYD